MTTLNKRIAHQWLDNYLGPERAGDSSDLLQHQVLCHHPSGTWLAEPGSEQQLRATLRPQLVATGERRYFTLAERDYVVALGGGPPSTPVGQGASYWLQVFRIDGAQVVETWLSVNTREVDWEPLPTEPLQPSGAEDVNQAVLRRWWDEMLSEHRFETLMPELAGPEYIRHESTGSWTTTVADHLQRLKVLYADGGTRPRPRLQYRLVAEGDYVAGWGTMSGYRGGAARDDEIYSFIQLFRLDRGKLAETWLPGFAVGVDWEP
jgi:predicted SnoaL-like aldol condensation-catalyzing enzyme